MNHTIASALVLWSSMAILSFSASAAPEPDGQSGLSPEQRHLVDELLASQHSYECCLDAIAVCLKQEPVCPLALRLERFIRRMAASGMRRAEIERALVQRKQSMTLSGQMARIELDERFSAGDSSSPVVLALYACGRSELCAKLLPSLYYAVVSGRLKGKVRLYYRPFFPAGKEDVEACGRALVAAADQGRFWPYLLHLYDKRDSFQQCMLRKWADIKGLDRGAYGIAYDHPKTTALLEASRREGIENKVASVPGAFINGRKVLSELSVETLIDLLEEEYDRTGMQPHVDPLNSPSR